MGSGQSAQSPLKRPQLQQAHNNKKDEDDFHRTCRAVFDEADRNKNRVLDNGEFWLVLQNPRLNLKLSHQEVNDIRRLAEADGELPPITYEQFIPMFQSLLRKVSEESETDWNDWCKMHEPQTNAAYYWNKRTGQIQRNKPPQFNANRVEEQSFEYVSLDDGTELTTTVMNGVRMYMDWDQNQWRAMPQHMHIKNAKTDFRRGNTQINMASVSDSKHLSQPMEGVEEVDERVGEYLHPSRGVLHTYMFENSRNTRIYYDDRVKDWARMPLSWERNVVEVKYKLDAIDKILPTWKNVNEQMLTLRECNYDLEDSIVFAEINWGYKPYEAASSEPQRIERQMTRSGLIMGGDNEEDLGALSKAASDKLYELQTQLAAANTKITRLELENDDNANGVMRKLQRENTKIEKDLERTQNRAEQSVSVINTLQMNLQELGAKYAATQKQLLATRAEADKVHSLQSDIDALVGGGSAEQALRERGRELERMRTENTHLKMKVQDLKNQMKNPTNTSAAQDIFKALLRQVKTIQNDKEVVAQDMEEMQSVISSRIDIVIAHSRNLRESVHKRIEDMRAKYRAEVLQRKLLFNKLQELRGNIRVFLRARADERQPNVLQFPTEIEVLAPDLRGTNVMWEYDQVFGVDATQEQIYNLVNPVIMSCVDGYNVCLMAYGQTGSGKTYTMTGTPNNAGVNTRAIKQLLSAAQQDSVMKTSFSCSMVEVYNEQIYDLLATRREPHNLRTGVNGVYVEGILRRNITTEEQMLQLLEDATYNRTTAATKMNSDSSRSHLILEINVETLNTISNVMSNGRLTLVDLAGSERVSRSEATGIRLTEAAAINKSLSALAQVFQSIAQNSPHIPYRNSKLTHLLQDSLGGDSKTCVFVNVSPTNENLAETQSSLNFGKSIRKIELGPAKKHTGKSRPPRMQGPTVHSLGSQHRSPPAQPPPPQQQQQQQQQHRLPSNRSSSQRSPSKPRHNAPNGRQPQPMRSY